MQDVLCRLCAGTTTAWARLQVLQRYDVQYFRCTVCGSIQTETPYWLDEAYRTQGTGPDTGAVQRSLDAALRTAAFLPLIPWSPERVALDYGAGMGLFGRLMRDRGFNFFAYDRYQVPFYMDQFHAEDPSALQPALVTSHEVLEHLADPATELPAIFGRGADLVIVSTELFQGQGPDWPYLAPHHGQHVFFYTQRAMEMIGERFGYRYATMPMLQVYWRPGLEARFNVPGALQIANDPQRFGPIVLQAFLNHAASPYHHAIRDMDAIEAKARSARQAGG